MCPRVIDVSESDRRGARPQVHGGILAKRGDENTWEPIWNIRERYAAQDLGPPGEWMRVEVPLADRLSEFAQLRLQRRTEILPEAAYAFWSGSHRRSCSSPPRGSHGTRFGR